MARRSLNLFLKWRVLIATAIRLYCFFFFFFFLGDDGGRLCDNMWSNIDRNTSIAIAVGHPVEVGLAVRIRCSSDTSALDPNSLDLVAQVGLAT